MIDLERLTSQQRRVLLQLRRGPVRTVDFDDQPAVDGGDRILRTAARVGELRALGCEITSRKVRGSGDALVAEYTLVSEPKKVSKTPTDRDGGNDGREGPRDARRDVSAMSGPAPGADLTWQSSDRAGLFVDRHHGSIHHPANDAVPSVVSRTAEDLLSEPAGAVPGSCRTVPVPLRSSSLANGCVGQSDVAQRLDAARDRLRQPVDAEDGQLGLFAVEPVRHGHYNLEDAA